MGNYARLCSLSVSAKMQIPLNEHIKSCSVKIGSATVGAVAFFGVIFAEEEIL